MGLSVHAAWSSSSKDNGGREEKEGGKERVVHASCASCRKQRITMRLASYWRLALALAERRSSRQGIIAERMRPLAGAAARCA
jgi:hypothetical protein